MLNKILAVALVLLLVTSFGIAVQAETVQGGTFRYGMTTNPRGMFNPILYTEIYDGWVIDAVFDGLIEIDAELQPQPNLAESWEISADGLSITFHLNEGVKFHDGVEVTAKDVEYTYLTILHPEYTGVRYGNFRVLDGAEEYKAGETDFVPGIEVLDDYTIRFSTRQTFAPLLVQMNYGILPSHLLADIPVGQLEMADFNADPIGTGPFTLVEFSTGQHVILEANEEYFRGRPNIDTLVFQKVAAHAAPIYLQQNRVDFIEISPEHYPQVDVIDFVDIYVYEALNYSYIAFNLRQDRFADVHVRQALKYGFDRETYVDIILEGFGIVANAPMPQASWAFSDEAVHDYPYKPELASEMLAEAGWTESGDGVLEKDDMRLEFELLVPEGSRTDEQMALLFQQNMADLGVKVNLMFMDFSSTADRIDAREFDMFAMGWSLSVDPDPYGIWHSTVPWNDPGFYNDRSDELIDMGRSETDMETRQEIYAEWQQLINRELPYIFLNYAVTIGAANRRVRGLDTDPGPYGPLVGRQLLRSVWLEQ